MGTCLYPLLHKPKTMKKPFALLINDLHINRDNIDEFGKNWSECLDVCYANEVDKMLVGGDVFTNRNAQSLAPMLMVQKCFHEAVDCGISLYIAEGNHDKPNYEERGGWLRLYSDIKGVYVCDTFQTFEMEDCTLIMSSYFPEETMMVRWLKSLEESATNPAKTILYLHAGVHGALGNFDIPNEIPTELLKPYKRVLCGHYHNRCKIKGTNIEYIGSSRAHTFGEDEEKGYTLLYDDGSTKFVKNEVNVRYVTEDIDYTTWQDWKRTFDERYKIRLRIKCTAAEADTVDRDKLVEAGANKIEFVTEKLAAITAEQAQDEKFDTKNIQKEYKAFCKEKDVDSTLGIEYLNKIK